MKKIFALSFLFAVHCSFAQVSPSYPWQTGQILTAASLNSAIGSRTTNSNGSLTANAILLGNGGGDITSLLSFGSQGQILTSQGSGSAPVWSNASFINPMLAIGDIIIGGTAGLATRLPIGSSGQFLSVIAGSPAWGTNASGLTGTAAGLTAGHVTTNANLTGVITSSGNTTSIASQTGTGSKIVVDTSPTLITPVLGAATASSITLGSVTLDSTGYNGTVGGVSQSNGFFNAIQVNGATFLPGLALSSASTTGTLCWTTGSGSLTVDTTTTCLLSSIKYKENIKPLDDGLKSVMQLRPVSYHLKPQYDPGKIGEQIGLIAEEVAHIDDRLISKESDGSPHSVRYIQLTAVLVKAIQEQQREIEALKKDIKQLKHIKK